MGACVARFKPDMILVTCAHMVEEDALARVVQSLCTIARQVDARGLVLVCTTPNFEFKSQVVALGNRKRQRNAEDEKEDAKESRPRLRHGHGMNRSGTGGADGAGDREEFAKVGNAHAHAGGNITKNIPNSRERAGLGSQCDRQDAVETLGTEVPSARKLAKMMLMASLGLAAEDLVLLPHLMVYFVYIHSVCLFHGILRHGILRYTSVYFGILRYTSSWYTSVYFVCLCVYRRAFYACAQSVTRMFTA
jgi:hypothetical protein